MKKALSLFALAVFGLAIVPTMAFAAKPPPPTTTELVGYDVSYPQCGKRLPTSYYFAVVGVNGGTAASTNTCPADGTKVSARFQF